MKRNRLALLELNEFSFIIIVVLVKIHSDRYCYSKFTKKLIQPINSIAISPWSSGWSAWSSSVSTLYLTTKFQKHVILNLDLKRPLKSTSDCCIFQVMVIIVSQLIFTGPVFCLHGFGEPRSGCGSRFAVLDSCSAGWLANQKCRSNPV